AEEDQGQSRRDGGWRRLEPLRRDVAARLGGDDVLPRPGDRGRLPIRRRKRLGPVAAAREGWCAAQPRPAAGRIEAPGDGEGVSKQSTSRKGAKAQRLVFFAPLREVSSPGD